jgi:hypothetical protein
VPLYGISGGQHNFAGVAWAVDQNPTFLTVNKPLAFINCEMYAWGQIKRIKELVRRHAPADAPYEQAGLGEDTIARMKVQAALENMPPDVLANFVKDSPEWVTLTDEEKQSIWPSIERLKAILIKEHNEVREKTLRATFKSHVLYFRDHIEVHYILLFLCTLCVTCLNTCFLDRLTRLRSGRRFQQS